MPPPAKCNEFMELVRNSGVVEDRALEVFTRDYPDLPDDAARVAAMLVQSGLMTKFQTDLLLKTNQRKLVINGKYKLLDRLGAGGMGSVFLCEHKIMRRRVAIKVLPNSVAKDPSAVDRFHREARACAVLDHPNICRAHDVDQDGKMHFLVIEYIEGASLQKTVALEGKMEVRRAADCIRQTALGLQHAHEAGLVHRDIKPANLLLDRKGTVKILDMGLALFFHDNTDNLTQQFDDSCVLGTADYLAPEQAMDSHKVDIRADIYSLGLTFFFLLTGKLPYGEGTVTQKLLWHQMKKPKSVRELRPEVPEDIDAIITKMIAKKPVERYQTPQELADVLQAWLGGGSIPPPSTPTIAAFDDETLTIRKGESPPAEGAATRVPPAAAQTRVLRKSQIKVGPPVPVPSKTGPTKADLHQNGATSKKRTGVDLDDDNAEDSKRRSKKLKKKDDRNLVPIIAVAGVAVAFVFLGIGLLFWALTRGQSNNPNVGVPTGAPAPRPATPPASVTPSPQPPPKTDPKAQPKVDPKPPKVDPKPPPKSNPKPPPPPPPPSIAPDYFPYRSGLTLHYVLVKYVSDGMGVAVHQKTEFKSDNVIETSRTRAGLVQGGKYLAGGAVQWGLSPTLMRKFQVSLGKAQPLRYRIEDGHAKLGTPLLGAKDLFAWDPVLKLGAKKGDSWEWTQPNGVNKKYTVEKFETTKDGKDTVVVKSSIAGPMDTEEITHTTYARGVGEIQRVSGFRQKDKTTTMLEMKLVPE